MTNSFMAAASIRPSITTETVARGMKHKANGVSTARPTCDFGVISLYKFEKSTFNFIIIKLRPKYYKRNKKAWKG